MAQARTNLGRNIERIAKYLSDFLGNKNCYHNFTIVTGTFRSDTEYFFFFKLFDLEIKYPLNLIYLWLVSNLSIYSGDNHARCNQGIFQLSMISCDLENKSKVT